VLSTAGQVWTWGQHLYGALGQGKFSSFTPKQVELDGVVDVAAGSRHTIFI
jgi:alpha-tubulin suppressor-like RCC1 family protein